MPQKTYHRISCLSMILLLILIFSGHALAQYTYTWKTDTTYEGADSVNMVQPVQVLFLHQPIQVVPHSASLHLMRRYSVLLGSEWTQSQAYRLLQTFESVPQRENYYHTNNHKIPFSLWKLTSEHLQNDIEISEEDGQKTVLLSLEAFNYADPLLAQIAGVRDGFFLRDCITLLFGT